MKPSALPSLETSGFNLSKVRIHSDEQGQVTLVVSDSLQIKMGSGELALQDAEFVVGACAQREDLVSKVNEQTERLKIIANGEWGYRIFKGAASVITGIYEMADLAKPRRDDGKTINSRYPFPTLKPLAYDRPLSPQVRIVTLEGGNRELTIAGPGGRHGCGFEENEADFVKAVEQACREHEQLHESSASMDSSLAIIGSMGMGPSVKDMVNESSGTANMALAEISAAEMVREHRKRMIRPPVIQNRDLCVA